MVSRRTERAGLATAQWSVPIQHTNLNTASSEFDPSPTFDGLKLYFTSNRTVNFEPSWSLPFSTPVPVPELTSSAEREPHISADGLAIYFTSSRAGGLGGSDTWMADAGPGRTRRHREARGRGA
jgi:Tol biopolymer transport system component